jgi:hypothetical protein
MHRLKTKSTNDEDRSSTQKPKYWVTRTQLRVKSDAPDG